MQRRIKLDNTANPTSFDGRNDEEESPLQPKEENKGKSYSTKDKAQSSSFCNRSTCLACILLITIKKCIKLVILFIGVTIAGHFIKMDDKVDVQKTVIAEVKQPSASIPQTKHIPSPNVDGQKKLRHKLLELRERQSRGLDLNVKIRTRWVGDNAQYWGNDLDFTKEDIQGVPEIPENNLDENKSTNGNTPQPPDPLLSGEEIKLTPQSGKHTPTNNAIFGFAQGYDMDIYVNFLETLSITGYKDDVVLSVSADVSPEVLEYLATHKNVIVYKDEWDCHGLMRCKVTNLYYKDGKAVEDRRAPRPVATARYELYYAWSLQYSEKSWIMLIDFRDTYFQSNPFDSFDSSKPPALMLYEENRESLNLGKSEFNSRWLKTAYGEDTEKKFSSKPVICSGSTIGYNEYIRIYLRGMIQEFDKTKCILKGCDQGFHNYLYYSSKLSDWIPNVEVYQQGKGLINNLAALRDKPLQERGILVDGRVLNWDGKSLSAVVHQMDRDDDLKMLNRARKRDFMKRVKERKSV